MYTDPKFIKTVPANVEGRDFVVGDLHGCFDELTKLMKYVRFDPKRDRLFSTGDLIDRGPNSEECLSLLDKSWFYPVLGNHEDLLLTKIKLMEKGQNPELTQEEIIIIKQSESYLPKIFSMPLVYEIEHLLYDKIYILHAEILPEHLTGINQENDSKEYDRYFNSMKRFDFSESILDFFNSNRFSNIDYNLKQKLNLE